MPSERRTMMSPMSWARLYSPGAEYFVVEGDGGVGGGDAHRVAVVVGEALFRTLRFAGDEASACSWVHGETIAFLWCRGGADVGARAEAGVDERCYLQRWLLRCLL